MKISRTNAVEETIADIFSIFILFIGLSYLLRPEMWLALIIEANNNPYWALLIAMVTLPFGLVVVFGHNIWVWDWPVLVTIIGWVMTIKSCLYLVCPTWSNRFMSMPEKNLRRLILAGGTFMTLTGILLVYTNILKAGI
jgi:uncharacterized protein YjeT (DUF2065 family)